MPKLLRQKKAKTCWGLSHQSNNPDSKSAGGIKHKNPKTMQVIQKAIFTIKAAQLRN
jgi:hypothetical protein